MLIMLAMFSSKCVWQLTQIGSLDNFGFVVALVNIVRFVIQ